MFSCHRGPVVDGGGAPGRSFPPSFQPRNLKIFTRHSPALLPISPKPSANEEEYVVSRIRHPIVFISPRIILLTASNPTEWHPTTCRAVTSPPPRSVCLLSTSSSDLPCSTNLSSPARPRPELVPPLTISSIRLHVSMCWMPTERSQASPLWHPPSTILIHRSGSAVMCRCVSLGHAHLPPNRTLTSAVDSSIQVRLPIRMYSYPDAHHTR